MARNLLPGVNLQRDVRGRPGGGGMARSKVYRMVNSMPFTLGQASRRFLHPCRFAAFAPLSNCTLRLTDVGVFAPQS